MSETIAAWTLWTCIVALVVVWTIVGLFFALELGERWWRGLK